MLHQDIKRLVKRRHELGSQTHSCNTYQTKLLLIRLHASLLLAFLLPRHPALSHLFDGDEGESGSFAAGFPRGWSERIVFFTGTFGSTLQGRIEYAPSSLRGSGIYASSAVTASGLLIPAFETVGSSLLKPITSAESCTSEKKGVVERYLPSFWLVVVNRRSTVPNGADDRGCSVRRNCVCGGHW